MSSKRSYVLYFLIISQLIFVESRTWKRFKPKDLTKVKPPLNKIRVGIRQNLSGEKTISIDDAWDFNGWNSDSSAQNSDNSNTGSQLPNEESAGDTDTNQSSAGDNQDVSGGTSEDNKPPVQEEGTSADEGNSNWNDNQESAGDNKENVDETPIDDVDKPVQSDETSVDYGSSNEQTNANDNKEEISETSEDQIDEPTLPDETSTENGKPNDEDSNNPVDTEASSEETNQTNESNGEDDQSNKPSDSSKETVEDAENQPNCVCVDKNLCEEESSIKPNENTNENLDYESMDDVITWKRRNGQLCGINEVCCSKVKNNTLLCGTHKKFNYMEGMETVGDVFSRFGEFPWVLKLKKRFTEEESMECSASLLHPQVALTAAHCVLETGADDIEVRAGEWDVTNTNEPLPHQDIGVKRIILHPEFDHKNPKNDIAVLILEKPVHIADNINVICLPTPNYEVDENNCVAAGWGRKKIGGEMRAILKKVELPIVPSDKCEKNLRKTRLGKYFRLHKSFICAGGNGRDVCVGDGGSPLMCPSKNVPNTYVQVGVVSWGINCGVAEQPGVYANVKEFLDWIANAGSPEDIEPQDLSII